MREVLAKKLYSYIVENNPELLLPSSDMPSLNDLISKKLDSVEPFMEELLRQGNTPYAVAEQCLEEMVAEWKPSKYHYIRDVLEEEFPKDYERLVELGMLTYVISNVIIVSGDLWERYEFSEMSLDDRFYFMKLSR